jgi:hypothetical protein
VARTFITFYNLFEFFSYFLQESRTFDFDKPHYDPVLEADLVKDKLTEEDIEDMMMKTFRVTFGSTIRPKEENTGRPASAAPASEFIPKKETPHATAPVPRQWDDLSLLFSAPSKNQTKEAEKGKNLSRSLV